MKLLLASLLLASCCCGQSTIAVETPVIQDPARPIARTSDPLESVKAELALVRAQLDQLRLEFQYQMQVCQVPDVMRARLATIDAQSKAAKPAIDSKP